VSGEEVHGFKETDPMRKVVSMKTYRTPRRVDAEGELKERDRNRENSRCSVP
jgi:hypothetical protein